MEADELQSVCVDRAFHPHHGRGGGRENERDLNPGYEALFFSPRLAANQHK